MQKKQIRWNKWTDPSLNNEDDEDDDDSFEKQKKPQYLFNKIVGLVPHKHSSNYNFHICHTNFDLCKKQFESISKVAGVETLEPITRYRFRVAIAELFNERQCKLDIEQALTLNPLLFGFANTLTLTATLKEELEKKLNSDNFVYILPNHQYEIWPQEDNYILDSLELFKWIGGGIFTKWTI